MTMSLFRLQASLFAAAATALAMLNVASAAEPCGSHLRFVHGHAFEDRPVDVYVNGALAEAGVAFREVRPYRLAAFGPQHVRFVDPSSGRTLGERHFPAGSGQAYTVVLAGPAKGPEGALFGNESPFVFLDDLTPPNAGRWKGTWYRMSETQVVIDFRISQAANSTQEVTRLIQKPNRAAYNLGDFPAGTYQFNPVLPGSSEPFFNPALNPPRNVELRDVKIAGGELFDIFALGNFLGREPNSLDLVGVRTRVALDANGCVRALH
jgi:hypothetical protein